MNLPKNINFFKKTNKGKITSISRNDRQKHTRPIDSTKELLENDHKDKALFKYYKEYEKKDFFDRYRKLYYASLVGSVLLGAFSIMLSVPFVQSWLNAELSGSEFVVYSLYFSAFALFVLEVVKHLSISQSAQTLFTYSQKPIIALPIALMCFLASAYMCVNGVKTEAQKQYLPPTSKDIVTQYDSQINQIKEDNKRIFKTNNWKGRLNESSKAGKAYAANEILLSSLQTKAAAEKEEKLNTAINNYNTKHTQVHSFRLYIGYVVESGIFFCLVFSLAYRYYSHYEHALRITGSYIQGNNAITQAGYNSSYGQVATNQKKQDSFNFEYSPTPSKPLNQKENHDLYSRNQIGFRSDLKDKKNLSENLCNVVTTSVTTKLPAYFKTTGKVKTFQQVENGLRSYKGYKKRGERDQEIVNARINYYTYMRDIMKAQDTYKIDEIVFDVEAWKNKKEVAK